MPPDAEPGTLADRLVVLLDRRDSEIAALHLSIRSLLSAWSDTELDEDDPDQPGAAERLQTARYHLGRMLTPDGREEAIRTICRVHAPRVDREERVALERQLSQVRLELTREATRRVEAEAKLAEVRRGGRLEGALAMAKAADPHAAPVVLLTAAARVAEGLDAPGGAT